jgi:hypothetical protein
MEMNPIHPIVSELCRRFDSDTDDQIAKVLVWLMLETALLTPGLSLDEPVVFADRVYRLIEMGLGTGNNNQVGSSCGEGSTGGNTSYVDLASLRICDLDIDTTATNSGLAVCVV